MAKPATSLLLLSELEKFLAATLRGYPFPAPDGAPLDCKVFQYGLPEGQEEKTYPFVIIRWVEGEISSQEDQTTLLQDTILLALGVYNPQDPAHSAILLAELIDCLRAAIWRERVLASRFELETLRCQIVEPGRQQHRYHLVTMETKWNYIWPSNSLHGAGLSQIEKSRLAARKAATEIEFAWNNGNRSVKWRK